MLAYDFYDDADVAANRRSDELAAFAIVDAKLKAVAGAEAKVAAVDAAYHARILWAALISDLGQDDNALDPALRASLISVGLRMLDCAERLREGDLTAADEIADVGRIVSQGLTPREMAA
ncbi:MAG: flagellar biosynthesis regulator FlaF [Pseudomonadota bacterium]